MSAGLPLNRVINMQVSLTPPGAQFANLSSLLILGDSDVIDVQQRIRTYSGSAAIGADFGTTSPEYLAAVNFFAQKPAPLSVMVGKWAQGAVAGRLIGAALTVVQQALSNFTAITNGALKLVIDGGAPTTLSALNLSGVTTMNGLAAIINTALAGAATCVWTGTQFQIKSATTGAASSVAFPTAPGAGTDLKALLGLTAAQGARSVAGVVAESALAAVQALDVLPGVFWYGLMLASTHAVDADHIAIAAYVEGDANLGPHIYGVTSQAAAAPDGAQTTDIGSVLTAAGYQRSFGHYSSSDPYAVASDFGRMLTVNWLGANTSINMMFQQLAGQTAEVLTVQQANTLDAKRYNYTAAYTNGASILQRGVMFGLAYIDEVLGADWLANYIQTNLFNLQVTLAAQGQKIPQTDDGVHLLLTDVEKSLTQGVTNGFLAPGTWTAGGFGQLALGDYLPKGFYVYAPPISTQASSERSARNAPAIQIAAKTAGAIDGANIALNINR